MVNSVNRQENYDNYSENNPDFSDIQVEIEPINKGEILSELESKALYGSEQPDVIGGSYKEVTDTYSDLRQEGFDTGHGYEAHHVLAYDAYKDVLDVSKGEGASILMEKADHKNTRSYGYSDDAVKYREEQSSLLQEGKFEEAWMMDVSDIKSKFEDKYDVHLANAEKQLLSLDNDGKIELSDEFKQSIESRQEIVAKLETAQESLNLDGWEQKEKLENEIEGYKEELKASYAESIDRYSQDELNQNKDMTEEIQDAPSVESDSYDKSELSSSQQETIGKSENSEVAAIDNNSFDDVTANSKESFSFDDVTANTDKSYSFDDVTSKSDYTDQFEDIDIQNNTFDDIVKPEIEVNTPEKDEITYDSFSL